MKTKTTLFLAAALAAAAGCEKKVDPRDRPGFVDTSDPSKAMSTMTPAPKGKSVAPPRVPGASAPNR